MVFNSLGLARSWCYIVTGAARFIYVLASRLSLSGGSSCAPVAMRSAAAVSVSPMGGCGAVGMAAGVGIISIFKRRLPVVLISWLSFSPSSRAIMFALSTPAAAPLIFIE